MSDIKISEAAPAVYGIRVKGNLAIVGVLPVPLKDFPVKNPEWDERYEEVPLYLQPQPAELAEQQGVAAAWYVFADTEHWVTLDEDEAEENREEGCQVRTLVFGDIAAPPAQGIDLGPVRKLLRRRMAQWRSHLPSDPDAPGTVAISGDGEGGYNNDVRMYREGIALMDRVLALIDDQRDAAPGVGNG